MAEVTNELIYEVLKAMQTRMSNLEDQMGGVLVRLSSIDERLLAVSHSVNAAHLDIANIYKKLSILDDRVSRIERRLDIVEEPAE
jgi:hypothetical protein